ncbi:hypothetical protein, partial [Lacticaseibacillus nasuensis]|uniref:hypothetical protein n=1 Tax=Lacticaseibacillus nasuensis TaxID=944671 RepID=UPI00192CE9FE
TTKPTDVGNDTTATPTDDGGIKLKHDNGNGTTTETTIDPKGGITSQKTTTPVTEPDDSTDTVVTDGKGGHTVNGTDVP